MKFMERRGSGLRKIVSETEKLPGYTEELRPEFHSSGTDFRVMLKNVNYNLDGADHDTDQVTDQDDRLQKLIQFCAEPRTREEMMEYLGLSHRGHFRTAFLNPLLSDGKLRMIIPEKPTSRNQKYIKAE